jgi:hypothetical protein
MSFRIYKEAGDPNIKNRCLKNGDFFYDQTAQNIYIYIYLEK